MRKLAQRLVTASEKIAEIQASISEFLVLAGLAIITYGVIMRYVFRQGVGWTWEIPRFLFLLIVALTLSYVQAKDKHIRVDILLMKLPGKAQHIVKAFCYVVFLFFSFILLRAAIVRLGVDWIVRSDILGFPLAPIEIILCIGIAALMLQLLVGLGKELKNLKTGAPPDAPTPAGAD
ncbi:MAG: TRAP transporter small permease [Chloroflexi bacterium]|nr:TRAP transporter small permease [Chloroflexota bacterium]